MDIEVGEGEFFRVNGGQGSMSNFIDIGKAGYSGLSVTLFSGFQYIEIRKKEGQLRVFTFSKKSLKKEYDFGYWEGAEVVYCLNEQTMHKKD